MSTLPPAETTVTPDEELGPKYSGPVGLLKAMIKLIRPKQWSKNILIFAAILFANRFRDPHSVRMALAAFVAMCVVSSGTYIFNDLVDVERDRRHPKKRLRPLASGAVSKQAGVVLGISLFVVGLGLGFAIGRGALLILLFYLALQVVYNWRLKRMPIADVYVIAIGFVLRAVLGATAVHVGISGWFLFCTGALALMLGFAKRRNEFILQGDDRTSSRESLIHYTRASLDALVTMFAAGAAMCYGIYTVESATAHKYPALILTSLFVFYGITRYVLIVFTADEGGEPADILFKDPHIIASVVLFLVTAVIALSGARIHILEQ